VHCILNEGIKKAHQKYHQPITPHFKTSKKIAYNLLVHLQFKWLAKHFKIMKGQYGLRSDFLWEFGKGIFLSPFIFIKNFYRKRFK
jgi:hypothetical protein